MGTCNSTANRPKSHTGTGEAKTPVSDQQAEYAGPLLIELHAVYNAPLVPVKKLLGFGPEATSIPQCQVSVRCYDSEGKPKTNTYEWPVAAAESHNPRWMQPAILGSDRALNDRLDFTLKSVGHQDDTARVMKRISSLSPTVSTEEEEETGTILGHAELILDSQFELHKLFVVKFDLVPECRSVNGGADSNEKEEKSASISNPESCEMVISFLPPPPEKKIVFMIRHGESRWNEGQEKMTAAHQLVGSVDHSLSYNGYLQAEKLAAVVMELQTRDKSTLSIGERKFLDTEVIYSSPMTRALQTACLGLATHPTLQRSGLKLMSCAREYKNTVASLDCVANSLGVDIIDRAIKETQAVMADEQTHKPFWSSERTGDNKKFDSHAIFGVDDAAENEAESGVGRRISRLVDLHDVGDPVTEWWTDPLESDSGQPFEDRLDVFMAQLRLRPERVSIVVGHSYFIRALCGKFTHPDCLQQAVGRRVKLADLGEAKVANCGVVALNMDFGTSDTRPIVGGELLFGTNVGKTSQRGRRSGGGGGEAEEDTKKRLDFNSWHLGPSGAAAAISMGGYPGAGGNDPPPPPPPLGTPTQRDMQQEGF